MNTIEHLNQTIFLRMNAADGTSRWLIDFAIFLANDVIFLLAPMLAALWICGDWMRRSTAIKACLVTLLAMGVTQIIIQAWPHPRPFMIGLGHTWIPHAADSSFPSDHVTVFACIGLTLWRDRAPRAGLATLAAGLAVAWSRIFLGVHFPLDMLGSLALASVCYMVIGPIWLRVGDTATTLIQNVYRTIFVRIFDLGWKHR